VKTYRTGKRGVSAGILIDIRAVSDIRLLRSANPTVVEIVTVKASKNLKAQQLSTTGMQQVQYQSLKINNFPQISITIGIWFGTR
jgi:hypothetical protein